jgi:hypothetical protein
VRHRLTHQCVDHLCLLLRNFNLPNSPKNSDQLKRILLSDPAIHITSTTVIVCPDCCSISNTLIRCTKSDCSQYRSFNRAPFEQTNFSLLSQLRAVISSNTINFPTVKKSSDEDNVIRDISDGKCYQAMLEKETMPFISLTMNVDGVEVAKSSKASLWIVTFAVNEIERKSRFKMKNLVVGVVLSGGSKPSRDHVKAFL